MGWIQLESLIFGVQLGELCSSPKWVKTSFLPKYKLGVFSLPGGSDSRESGCNVGTRNVGPIPWRLEGNLEKIPWRREWQPSPVFLPGESHGQRSLAGNTPMGLQRGRHNWVTSTNTPRVYSGVIFFLLSSVVDLFQILPESLLKYILLTAIPIPTQFQIH